MTYAKYHSNLWDYISPFFSIKVSSSRSLWLYYLIYMNKTYLIKQYQTRNWQETHTPTHTPIPKEEQTYRFEWCFTLDVSNDHYSNLRTLRLAMLFMRSKCPIQYYSSHHDQCAIFCPKYRIVWMIWDSFYIYQMFYIFK